MLFCFDYSEWRCCKKSMKDYWSKQAATKTSFFLKFLVIKGFSNFYIHFTLLITLVCHQDYIVINYGKLGWLLIFLLIDFLVFSCQLRTPTSMKVCFCGKEDFFQEKHPQKWNRFGKNFFYFVIVKLNTFLFFHLYRQ